MNTFGGSTLPDVPAEWALVKWMNRVCSWDWIENLNWIEIHWGICYHTFWCHKPNLPTWDSCFTSFVFREYREEEVVIDPLELLGKRMDFQICIVQCLGAKWLKEDAERGIQLGYRLGLQGFYTWAPDGSGGRSSQILKMSYFLKFLCPGWSFLYMFPCSHLSL